MKVDRNYSGIKKVLLKSKGEMIVFLLKDCGMLHARSLTYQNVRMIDKTLQSKGA